MPPEALVPVAPVPAPVPMPVLEPGRPFGVLSLIVPVPVPDRLREALSVIVPVLVVAEPLAPVAPVPDIEPGVRIEVSAAVPAVPLVPVVPPAAGVPTSPPLVPAVLSRLLPLLQAPTASTAASASTLLPIVTFRMVSPSALGYGAGVRQKGSQRGRCLSLLVPSRTDVVSTRYQWDAPGIPIGIATLANRSD